MPHSQVFGTLVYPKAVTLNPGTTYSMPIVFKPLESKQYEDKIEFKTKVRLKNAIVDHHSEIETY